MWCLAILRFDLSLEYSQLNFLNFFTKLVQSQIAKLVNPVKLSKFNQFSDNAEVIFSSYTEVDWVSFGKCPSISQVTVV